VNDFDEFLTTLNDQPEASAGVHALWSVDPTVLASAAFVAKAAGAAAGAVGKDVYAAAKNCKSCVVPSDTAVIAAYRGWKQGGNIDGELEAPPTNASVDDLLKFRSALSIAQVDL
jgi:hypothetical protein